jgi:hypothetical protein
MRSTYRRLRRRLGLVPPRPQPPPFNWEAYPDWPTLLQADWPRWQRAVRRAQGGPRVLLPTSIAGDIPGCTFESLLAVALTLRGAEVHILLCDQHLPACQNVLLESTSDPEAFARSGVAPEVCRRCFNPGNYMYQRLGLPVHYYSQMVTPEQAATARQVAEAVPLADIPAYTYEGLRVGEHAAAGALRFFARGDFQGEPLAEPVLRQYLRAALLTVFATRTSLRRLNIKIAAFHHGIYIPQGIVAEVARQEGARLAVWTVAYRTGCFIASHGDTYHHTLMTEPVEAWQDMPWTPQHETQIMQYLRSRWQGTRDWIWFHDMPQEDEAAILREVKLDRSRPIIGAFTNVIWDAQLHYPANAFPNMQTWMFETIRYFARRPELQLVIRIHPAELRGTVPSRQRMLDEIQCEFPELPANIFIVPPESQVSSYVLASMCNAAIIYGTKMGVELSSLGIPVIAAGEAWIRNKGLTRDARTPQEYMEFLDELPVPGRLAPATTQRARKYAFHYFFRRMIPVDPIHEAKGWPPYRVHVTGLDEMGPGGDKGLDILCQGILTGSPFIYPAEQETSLAETPLSMPA